MHDYAIFNHDRAKIGRWLGVISILIAGTISQILIEIYNLTGIEAFAKATITIGLIYFILHYAFNNYIWKLQFFKIPDLSGKWKVIGRTLNEDGTIKYEWTANIGIEQNWEKIIINLKTDTSQSFSQTATLEKQHGLGSWLLSYSYKNEPKINQSHELNAHKGYCQIEFDTDITTGDASYFNNNGRRTFGQMQLIKEIND
jgi:hypothetical protein